MLYLPLKYILIKLLTFLRWICFLNQPKNRGQSTSSIKTWTVLDQNLFWSIHTHRLHAISMFFPRYLNFSGVALTLKQIVELISRAMKFFDGNINQKKTCLWKHKWETWHRYLLNNYCVHCFNKWLMELDGLFTLYMRWMILKV